MDNLLEGLLMLRNKNQQDFTVLIEACTCLTLILKCYYVSANALAIPHALQLVS